ncbi:hypothetical protein V9T40_010837 [Parthenolecanium corni]|uniref:C2H2-type domain-containing protein n=1 Tax=Parthenolecanium corni TaxID=536013 RepID=A0AAN9TIU2_9HEMI
MPSSMYSVPNDFYGCYSCPRCHNSYRWKKNLTRHLKLECGKEPTLQCPLCPLRTKHKSSLRGDTPSGSNVVAYRCFQCSRCLRLFKDGLTLWSHVSFECRMRSPDVYNCEFCVYKSKWKSNLKRHKIMVHKHLMEPILFFQDLYLTAFSSFILSCFNRCPKFNSNSVNFLFAEPFLTFVSTFYGQTGANDSQWNTAVSSQNVIKHECPKCGKTYKYNQNLKRHMKYECGKPPTLKCPHCDYITFYKYDLFNHAIRRHPNDYMKMRNDFVATKP